MFSLSVVNGKIVNGTSKAILTPNGYEWGDRRSALGNPFRMNREAERDAVCDAYEEYYFAVVTEGEDPSLAARRIALERNLRLARSWKEPTWVEFMAERERLRELLSEGDVAIACWCKPDRCHLDTVQKDLKEQDNEAV